MMRKKITIAIICASVYVLSANYMWNYMHMVYSKGGCFEHRSPSTIDVFVVYFPVTNTVCTLLLLPPKINLSNHFKITK